LDKGSQKSYALGLTRTYFRAGALELLEAERIKGFDPAAATIQKVARGFLVRKRRNNEYIVNRRAATIIQTLARVKLAIKHVARVREAKMNTAQLDRAATTINAIARGAVRRMRFKQELKRFREVNAMKVELQQLQDMIKQSEAEKEEAIKAAETRVRAAMDMIHEDKSQASSSSADAQETTRKLDAKNKEIEKMRSDNKRVRANIKLLEGKFKRLNEELKKKQDFNEKETERFMALNNEAKAISEQNAKEQENQEIWKKQAFALVAELKRMNETFVEIRKTREQYQNAMTDILKMLRTRSKQEQLVEDSIFIALESDAEVKALRASFQAIQAHLEEKQNGGKVVPKAIRNSKVDTTESTEMDSTSQHSELSSSESSTSGSAVDIDEDELDAEEALMAAELDELSNEVGV
jgi:myosin heavy subunit